MADALPLNQDRVLTESAYRMAHDAEFKARVEAVMETMTSVADYLDPSAMVRRTAIVAMQMAAVPRAVLEATYIDLGIAEGVRHEKRLLAPIDVPGPVDHVAGDGRQDAWRECPDTGTCHHECTVGCWRVAQAGPLTVAGFGDHWPNAVTMAHAKNDGHF